MIIGLTGVAGVGKDTVANIICEGYGFEAIAFADPLRRGLMAINPIVGDARLADVINKYGWNGYKKSRYSDEIRGLIQRTGTEFVRDMIGDSTWIDIAMHTASKIKNVVITDIRFENEFNAVKNAGGKVYRVWNDDVMRRHYENVATHSSESGMANFPVDDTIVNNGTLIDLGDEVHKKVFAVV